MRRKIILVAISILVALGTGANAYFLRMAYGSYLARAKSKVVMIARHDDVANAKEQSVDTTQQGQQVAHGQYAYEERDRSKIDPKQAAGRLLIASNESQAINYLLATGPDTKLTPGVITANWSLQTLSDDPMWSPGACASKPTYFLQNKYVFIDDGKTVPTDKYNSYVVFNMLTQKFGYFGGDNFTDEQATKEKILSVVDQNDQMVFYIDPADKQGPLADSSSFKHARGYAAGYIIRRVIDLDTLHYTDYKLPYTLPDDKTFDFYYVNNGSNKDELITLSSDTSDTYYSGKVSSNTIMLASKLLTVSPLSNSPTQVDPLASSLNAALISTLPDFMPTSSDVLSQQGPRFDITVLGSRQNEQYLVVSNKNTGYATPLIYDSSSKDLMPLTTHNVLEWSNYVPLGVF